MSDAQNKKSYEETKHENNQATSGLNETKKLCLKQKGLANKQSSLDSRGRASSTSSLSGLSPQNLSLARTLSGRSSSANATTATTVTVVKALNAFRQGKPLSASSRSRSSSGGTHQVREVTYGLRIIWFGVGLSATLASLGFHWLISHATLWGFGILWGVFNIPLSEFFRSLFFTAAAIFFKDFDVAGAHRVPQNGPVLLVCAPHANQFIDPIVVLKALSHRRDIGFLSAASTLRKKYIGEMAAALNAIPVERPQDLAKPGNGRISLTRGSCIVTGTNTKFTEQFSQPNCSLNVKIIATDGGSSSRTIRVSEVINDNELRLTRPILKCDSSNSVEDTSDPEVVHEAPFKIFPKIDQTQTFAAVREHLGAGHIVGIFPEGGSHDQTKMLPLKIGCAFMALGACAQYEGLPLKIIPVGINYFRGHRFRSRVFIDVGEPITCSREQVQQYCNAQTKSERFNICNQLLQRIQVGLKTVTVESDNFNDLQFLRAVRRLYASDSSQSAEERFLVTKAFARCYERDKEKSSVTKLYDNILQYRRRLSTFMVSDYSVSLAAKSREKNESEADVDIAIEAGSKLLVLLVKVVIGLCVCMPGIIASFPIMLITRWVASTKAKSALKRSSVKVAGRDVMATWKILVSLVVIPVVHLLYTLASLYFLGEAAAVAWFFMMPIFGWISIKTTERFKSDLRDFYTLFKSTCFVSDTRGDLVARRLRLESAVREVITALKWDKSLEHSSVYRKFSESPFTWAQDEWEDDAV